MREVREVMFPQQIKHDLKGLISGKLLFDEPMRSHTSFGIGGPADALIVPSGEEDLRKILNFASLDRIPVWTIGNGTNLLVSDDGIEGIVVKISNCFDEVVISGNKVLTGAGCSLSELCRIAEERELKGLEFTVGIPGTVGGAVVMNAGAHGASVGDVVTNVKGMTFSGELVELDKKSLNFGYRKSKLQNRNLIVLSVEMELEKGDITVIKGKLSDYLRQRHEKYPLALPSAGSFFKNPENDYAARLIETCGCKGMRVGGAQVSGLHANFIVNARNATAQDVLQLMKKVQRIVLQRTGVKLEPEVKIIGRGLSLNNRGKP